MDSDRFCHRVGSEVETCQVFIDIETLPSQAGADGPRLPTQAKNLTGLGATDIASEAKQPTGW